MNQTGYQQGSAPSQGAASSPDEGQSLEKLKKGYLSYLDLKAEEIKEQQNARRYYHGAQWTAKQIKAFNDRKQPVVTYNRIARKINATVGLLARQRQDPRGFPRTEGHEKGAELSTAVIRYVLDKQAWAEKDPIAGMNGAVDGIAGIELMLEQGDTEDPNDHDVGFDLVDPASYFYDPRSLKADFSDARYMGIGKWADVDATIEAFPDRADEIMASLEAGSELTSNPDSDQKWYDEGSGGSKRLRIIDQWYLHKGQWRYCVYTGATKLAEGVSPFQDEKRKTICKYIMFSANVDQDGDRYGFVRNMMSSQDEINQRRSKGLHLLNSRRIIVRDGQGLDVEKVRKELARADGVVVVPPGAEMPEFDDANRGAELNGHLGFLEDAKAEIENYGFNPALMGTGVQDMSGRAIQLQQQAGIAELGPYLLAYKGWKLRVYRAVWNAVQQHWTAERAIRVTDDDQAPQMLKVNQLTVDPQTGQPVMMNRLGSLDVDIILDEGPDTITMQQANEETLQVLQKSGVPIPPKLTLMLAPLDHSVKTKATKMLDEAQQQAAQQQMPVMQAQMQAQQAETAETAASAKLKEAQTVKTMAEAQNVGSDAQDRAQEFEMKRWDGLHKQATERAKAGVDELMAQYDVWGKELDLVGKQMDIQRQREAPRPQAGA